MSEAGGFSTDQRTAPTVGEWGRKNCNVAYHTLTRAQTERFCMKFLFYGYPISYDYVTECKSMQILGRRIITIKWLVYYPTINFPTRNPILMHTKMQSNGFSLIEVALIM